MALFGNTQKNTAAKKETKAIAPKALGDIKLNSIYTIKRPRITEKASNQAGMNVFTFDVHAKATKPEIASAIRALYKVSPVKVAVVTIPSKRKMTRGRKGKTAGGKKAYVYLKKGDTIEFV